jgi:ABC-type phosphate transport system substrate-binding protein
MSLKRLNAYWARLQFSGAVQPPPEISDSQSVRDLVRHNKNAIGYIEASQVDDSVRVILLLKDEK